MSKSWIRATGSTTSTGGMPSMAGTKGEPKSVRDAYDERQGGGK